MNHLRSAAFVVVSTSVLLLAAGCNAGSDVTDETAPQTEIVTGLQSKAWDDGVIDSYCPKEEKVEAKAFYQVQASRVAKFIFGGNDPFDWSIDPATGNPVGVSKEFGDAGSARPDTGNPECYAAAKCWRQIHDSLYPPCANGGADRDGDGKPDPVDPKRGGTTCPAPDSTLSGGGLVKACEIPAELFRVKTGPSVTMPYEACIEGLDACWGTGVSGFIHVIDPYKKILGTDPEPADLTSPLASSTGATAAAVYTNSYVPTNAILWPATWQPGSATPGTPCSTYGLAAGSRTSKAIVANGSLRKCL